MDAWLKRVKHDLLKRVLWPARDLRDAGVQDVKALKRGFRDLIDEEGAPIAALPLWERLRAAAPPGTGAACDAFQAALERAEQGLDQPWPAPLQAILALEPAFEELARAVEEQRET